MLDVILQDVTVYLQLKQKPLTTFEPRGNATLNNLRVRVKGLCPALKYCLGKTPPFQSGQSKAYSGTSVLLSLLLCKGILLFLEYISLFF
jgi:hypothetical protein